MGELYRLDFPSGKSYIGITRHTAAHRYKGHLKVSEKSGKGVIYRAWRKHGPPKLVVLAVISEADLYETERRAVAAYGTRHPHGYNATDGGDIPPSLDPLIAKKIGDALRGRKLPEDVRLKLVAAVTGRLHSAEAKKRMSEAQKGRKMTAEHRANLAKAKVGGSIPIAVREKMSEAQRARREREGCVVKPRKVKS